ncbi:MAG TPA: hydroxysqualene dehydroxylase HpnE [Mycobacteriales bacterium]|nr:hydroxysqualene dehydroxylase HpnE [Mycobacteriales bacterium]
MTAPTTGRRSVVVAGGGLAGIAAALRLADAGWSVRLLEAKPRLGGLTASFRRGDLDVDTGQHVFLRCCTAYRGLLDRLGVTGLTTLQDRLDVPVVRVADGRRGRLQRGRLPVAAGLPLHLGPSLSRYAVLPPGARLAAARAALALRAVDPDDPATDERSFGSWLTEHGQPAAAVAALWDLVGVATLNARSDEASLALAAMVFQTGLLTEPDAADIGWSNVPLQRLHGDAAMRELARAGAEVGLRTRVEAIEPSGGGWRVQCSAGPIDTDAVVVALPPAQTERVLPTGAVRQPAGWSEALGTAPIVNVHAVFDRRVMDEAFVACIGSPLQWLFDRTPASGLTDGQYLAASVSAADDVADLPVEQIRGRLLPEFVRALPAVHHAELRDFFVTREPRATFRQAPGSAKWRPESGTTMPGLVLAGAHTATGWPATMEGAVRSGDAAARALTSASTASAAGRPDGREVAA